MSLAIGQSCQRVFHVDDAAIEAFGAASGDRNPIHFDEAAGTASRFGGRVEVTAWDPERSRATLATQAWVGDTLVVDGEARVIAPR